MKTVISFILLVACYNSGMCQFNGNVEYNNNQNNHHIFLAINDSSSFTTTTTFAKKQLKKGKNLGDEFHSHNTYQNINQDLLLSQSHLDGKTKYLIHQPLTKWVWHNVDSTKTILGYECKMAFTHGYDFTIIAWYAPSLPTTLGPMDLNGLPGLILEIYNKTYNITRTATKVSLTPLIIVQPTKGKKVSREAFRKVKSSR